MAMINNSGDAITSAIAARRALTERPSQRLLSRGMARPMRARARAYARDHVGLGRRMASEREGSARRTPDVMVPMVVVVLTR